MRSFDVVVVGAGPAGEVAAGRLAGHGLKVAIVEDRLVGGECSFWACMPSKALLRPYEALAEVMRIPGAAEAVTGKLDVAAALARRDEIIHDLDDGAAAAVARGARGRADPRPRTAVRRAPGHRQRRGDRGQARRLPRHRLAAGDAADPRPGRIRLRVDEPGRDDREGDPGPPRGARRRRGRRRALAGLPDARLAGHADRGRAAADPQRGGVRLHRADRGAARAAASTSARRRRRRRSSPTTTAA